MNSRQQLEKIRTDIQWAVESPDLMSNIAEFYGHGLPVNSISDALPFADLVNWLENELQYLDPGIFNTDSPLPLGIYFEKLWHLVLDNYPGFELIAHNLPVTNSSRTLGEFDFIYFCAHRQRYIHMETAVKFYLGIPPAEKNARSEKNWQNWIGPGCKDRLDIKLLRMVDHQCRISEKTEAKELLAKLGIDEIDPEICLKGYFFYPLHQDCSGPLSANENHAKGFWVRLGKINALVDKFQEKLWLILPKQGWFSPRCFYEKTPTMSFEVLTHQLKHHFKTSQRPLMVACIDTPIEQSGAQSCQVKHRGFIVPDDWPST